MEKQFVSFQIGTSFYCIDIMEVQEVVRENQITHMPNFPAFVEGVINLRGVITPLISIDKRLSLSSKSTNNRGESLKDKEVYSKLKPDKPLKLIIVNVDTISIGLVIDTLDKILIVDEHLIQYSDGLTMFNDQKIVSGIIHMDGNIYLILDTQYMLEGDETQQLMESFQKIQ